MIEEWIMLRGDLRGQTRHMEIAAIVSTFVDPEESALRSERATELRSDTSRLIYMLNPNCYVAGEHQRTSIMRDALLDGTIKVDQVSPVADCLAGLVNAQAIRGWMMNGKLHRLKHTEDGQRSYYIGESPGLVDSVITISTHSIAKAAALGRLGMALYNVTGTREAPQFICQRYSVGMRDADGHAITYDAAALIMGEINDELPLDHPFILAYSARINFERLYQHIAAEIEPLIVTPDVIDKSAAYDPNGFHSYISPDAPGHIWDNVERDFFG